MRVHVTADAARAALPHSSGAAVAGPLTVRAATAPAAAGQPTAPDSDAVRRAQDANGRRAFRTGVRLVLGGLLSIGLFALVCWLVIDNTSDTVQFARAAPKPVDGTTIFAVFFVAAAAIERLLEPLADLMPDKAELQTDAQAALAAAGAANTAPTSDGAAADALTRASERAALERYWVYGQTVGFWLLASAIGVLASAVLKLYLPYVVGIAQGGRASQIIATGLIIGGGTKPLHDLVGYISAAKEAKAGG